MPKKQENHAGAGRGEDRSRAAEIFAFKQPGWPEMRQTRACGLGELQGWGQQPPASLQRPEEFPNSASGMAGPDTIALHRKPNASSQHFTPRHIYVQVFNSDLGSISCLKLSIFHDRGLRDDEKLTWCNSREVPLDLQPISPAARK